MPSSYAGRILLWTSILTDFLKDIFSGSYSEFLLNFGTEQLMASLEL